MQNNKQKSLKSPQIILQTLSNNPNNSINNYKNSSKQSNNKIMKSYNSNNNCPKKSKSITYNSTNQPPTNLKSIHPSSASSKDSSMETYSTITTNLKCFSSDNSNPSTKPSFNALNLSTNSIHTTQPPFITISMAKIISFVLPPPHKESLQPPSIVALTLNRLCQKRHY